MIIKSHLLLTSIAFVALFITSCNDFRTKTYKHYLFPYQTVVTKVNNDACTNSVTEKLLMKMSDMEEAYLRRKNTINFDEEAAYGRELHTELSSKLVSNAVSRRVEGIFNRLKDYTKNERYNYQIYVVDLPFVNAFSAPGGKIYCTLPLTEELDDDELAFVIGHELGHLENLHCLKSASRYAKLGAIYSALSSGLHQKDELEADYAGAYLAYKGGFDPKAGSILFKKWAKKEKTSKWTTFLQSHPNSGQRSICVGEYVAQAEQEGEIKIYPIYYFFVQEYPLLVLVLGVFISLISITAYKRQWHSCLKFGIILFLTGLGYFLLDKNVPKYKPSSRLVNLNDKTTLSLRATPKLKDDNIIMKMGHGSPVEILLYGPYDTVEGKVGRWALVRYDNEVNGWTWAWKLKEKEQPKSKQKSR